MKATVVFIVLFVSLKVFAFSDRSPDSLDGKRGIKTPNINFFLTHPGASSLELKKSLIEETDPDFELNTQLQWPPLPRAWLEYATTDYITSNTFLGFKASPQLFGFSSMVAAKLNYDFRYQIKSSFVVIATRNSKNQLNNSLIKFDEKNVKTYLNISQSTPMVGLCIYEVQFAYDKGAAFNFEILGSGQNLNKGQIKSVSNTHFSQFFQIKPKDNSSEGDTAKSRQSIDVYQSKCNDFYRLNIEEQVNADISKQIMSLVFHNHPKSKCKPEQESFPDGDPTCQEWFKENIHPMVQKSTVPRCTLKQGGIHACELRAKKEKVSCPMYLNADDTYTDKPLTRKSRKVTNADPLFPNYPCDEQSGLSCELISEPYFLGRISFGNAEARCKKTQSLTSSHIE